MYLPCIKTRQLSHDSFREMHDLMPAQCNVCDIIDLMRLFSYIRFWSGHDTNVLYLCNVIAFSLYSSFVHKMLNKFNLTLIRVQ